MNIVSERIYSPQAYLEFMTGNTYFLDSSVDNDIEFIENKLKDFFGKALYQNYRFSTVETGINPVMDSRPLVLVECNVYNNNTHEYEKVYRWFEVPDGFEELD